MFRSAYHSGHLSILYAVGSRPLGIWEVKGAPPAGVGSGRRFRGGAGPRLAAATAGAPARSSHTDHTKHIRPLYIIHPPTPTHPPTHPPTRTEGDGAVARVTDAELASSVIELRSPNVTTTTATCPAPSAFASPAAAAAGLGVRLPVLVLLVKAFPGEPFTLEVALRDDAGHARRLRASTFQSAPRVAPAVAALPLHLPEGWAALAFDLHDFCRRAYGTGFAEATRVTVRAVGLWL
jgi:hypothetical protein